MNPGYIWTFLFAFCIGGLSVSFCTDKIWRDRLTRNNHAYYVVDEQTGESKLLFVQLSKLDIEKDKENRKKNNQVTAK